MAASVDNRQFGRLVSPVRPVGKSLPTHRPSVSPASRHSTTPPALAKDKHSTHFAYDDESDEDEAAPIWTQRYGGSHLGIEQPVHDSRDEGTADSWVERSPYLIRLTGKHPFNSEPPLARLMRHGFVTPVPLHYVRNHGAVPKADWATWTIEITGLVRRPVRLTMDEIAREFAKVEIPVTLVCAGNRRKEQNMVRQTVGFNWGPAAVSTSVWGGARLRDVLRRCGALERSDRAHFVCFEGAEDLPGGEGGGGGSSTYGTSLRREVAMDPSNDVMLAYMQNGELLTPDHGFPVRVIIPGFIGGRMVKWLKRIIVAPLESESHYHYKDNRVLPCHVDANLADAEAWWYKAEYIINELNINSVITTPGHDDTLPINAVTAQWLYTLKGYAYSGGGRRVTRVEVTLDGGETWLVCALDHPEKPNKYGKYWCWCFWSVAVELWQLLGAEAVAVRAWDESLNTQPEKLIWNVMGMMNNCWFRVKVNVRRPDNGELAIVFEHPTQPGNLPGGWMARPKHLESLEPLFPPMQKSSAAFVNTSFKQFTMSDVNKHNSCEFAWILVHGFVYDCTSFLKDHPGGADSILLNAGGDCTEEFDDIHSNRAKTLLGSFCIGKIIPSAESDVYSALSIPREKTTHCTLVSKKAISRDVRLFRFALPSVDQLLGLPVGKYVLLCATIDGKPCARPYSPTSPADEAGYFELLIKVYDGGVMSRHLDALPAGSALEVKSPFGEIEYAGRGHFLVNGKRRFARRFAMIAGGTGITPVYQVIQAVLRDQEDRTEMHLVYANRSEDNILLREELDRWEREHPERFTVWYVVDEAMSGEAWRYSTGLVTDSVLRGHIPVGGDDDTLALACGPPAMVQLAVVPNLKKMGYDVANSLLLF